MIKAKKEVKSLRQKTAIKCSCGYIVTGNSKIHAETALEQHKKSKRHRQYKEMLKNIYSGDVVYSEENKEGGERRNNNLMGY